MACEKLKDVKLCYEYYPTFLYDMDFGELKLKPIHKYVLLELMVLERRHKKDRGDEFSSSTTEIANRLGYDDEKSINTVRRYLQDLQKKNLIAYYQQGKYVKYHICWANLDKYINDSHIRK